MALMIRGTHLDREVNAAGDILDGLNKQSTAIGRLHELKVRVGAEHLLRQARQLSPPSQQRNKGPRQNNMKEIKTRVIKIQEWT